MKISSVILLLGIIIAIHSCEPNVVFETAQPRDIEAIDKIPEQFQGTFMCESDSTYIKISDFVAFQERRFIFITTIQQVRETENCSIADGGLYLPGRKDCIPFDYLSEDSIRAEIWEYDTLFSFHPDEVAKFYKGHLFLNQKLKTGAWMTWMLTPENNDALTLKLIDVPDNLKTIEKVSHEVRTIPKEDDKYQYVINPTLVEFDRILEMDFLLECETLFPVNFETEKIF